MRVLFAARRLRLAAASAVILMGMLTAGLAYASGAFTAGSGPTSPTNFTVVIGGGAPTDFTNLQYTPRVLNIYAGDSVTFKTRNDLEPHTVSFGPKKLLTKLSQGLITPVGGTAGPPTLVLSSKVVQPTKRMTYNGGKGYASSGILSALYKGVTKTSWTITFSKPGRYEYFCLIHYPVMNGWIIVHPRPAASTTYSVQAGYGGKT